MNPRARAVAALLLFALAAAVYAPALGHPFIPYDDPAYVDGNPVVSRGLAVEGAKWAFTTFHAANWHPLAWLSHMLDVSLFGVDAGAAHGVNVLFHGLNAVLLFLFLSAATGAAVPSLAAAALFAVHPLHVESVAWIAERKDVLCAFFVLLSLHAWLRYARTGGKGSYVLAAAFHALALLSKPMAVTVPLLLLLLDRWPLRRGPFAAGDGAAPPLSTGRLLAEKVPFLALSAASSAVTLLAQRQGGAVNSLGALPLADRLANALLSYAAYLGKAAWPSKLAVFYPHPADSPGGISPAAVAASFLLAAALWGAALRFREKRPWILFGLAWYTAALLPVIGIVQVGLQGMADRYAYLPLAGVYVAAAWTARELAGERPGRRKAAAAAAALCVAALAVAARVQLSYWSSPWTLFSRAARVIPRNYQAEASLGMVLVRERRFAEAEGRFREGISFLPSHAASWGGLGLSFLGQGRDAEAEEALRRAIRLGNGMPEDRKHLGVALQRQGRHGEAAEWLRTAALLDPLAADTRYNLAISEEALGRLPEAEASYREAIRIRPDFGRAWNNLGWLLLRSGRPGEAVPCLEEAVRLDPDDSLARRNLGKAVEAAGIRG
jgi:tetratricopeptide (TPR) repeat protein